MNDTTSTDPLAVLRCNATVSVPFAAEILGVSESHGYWLARNGRLPVIKLGPRRMKVKSAELLRMLESDEVITPGRGNALSA